MLLIQNIQPFLDFDIAQLVCRPGAYVECYYTKCRGAILPAAAATSSFSLWISSSLFFICTVVKKNFFTL
jgi:hypothetical protein